MSGGSEVVSNGIWLIWWNLKVLTEVKITDLQIMLWIDFWIDFLLKICTILKQGNSICGNLVPWKSGTWLKILGLNLRCFVAKSILSWFAHFLPAYLKESFFFNFRFPQSLTSSTGMLRNTNLHSFFIIDPYIIAIQAFHGFKTNWSGMEEARKILCSPWEINRNLADITFYFYGYEKRKYWSRSI